ncbi:MAG TPA: patatin-like phospholipase family protein [Symbiobacteriaceae bacterium]|nr:patatin-like phospholipase family protein [Symbiobacteriaceae bacterium]
MARRYRITRMYRPGGQTTVPLKIALVLSGAVALGTFEAGVVYELLSAISRGAPLTVDIVAGSSAGALVGAMAAKSLVTGVPFEYVLPKWKEFTLTQLTSAYETIEQALARRKQPDKGILSSEAVRRILEEYLVTDPVERSFQPNYPAPRVILTITMTNLDGIPGTGTPDDENRFSEAVIFRFSPPNPHRLELSPYPPAVWRRISEVARPSSAFPGAFDPGPVAWRDRIRIPGLLEEVWENEALLERLDRMDPAVQPKMRYADGGILDEEPLERAISMLPLVTGRTGEAGIETLVYDPRRCLLFIEPDPPATSLDSLKAGTQHSWFDTFTRGIRLWTLSASPVTSQRRVLTTNKRQELLLRFLADLARRMREDGDVFTTDQAYRQFQTAYPNVDGIRQVGRGAGGLGEAPGLIDPKIFTEAVHRFYSWLVDDRVFARDMAWLDSRPPGRIKDVHTNVRSALLELRNAYTALHGVDPISPGRHQAVLEEVHAALAESLGLAQPWVALHEITPDDPRQDLKGEEMVHFGGFFSEEFLQHDFQVGRYYAHLWLKEAVPEYSTPEQPERPPATEDGLNWRILWQNRSALSRMASRLVAVLMELVGLSYGGMGQLLVRLLGWSLLFSLIHGVLLLIGAWLGWIRFAPEYKRFRFWLLMGTSFFPLFLGLVVGLAFRGEVLRTIWSWYSRRRR